MSDFQRYLDESLSKIKIAESADYESVHEQLNCDPYTEIQEMIVNERKKQKITQKELARITGLSQSNISNIENGSTRPTIDSLQKIAEAFGRKLHISFEESEEI